MDEATMNGEVQPRIVLDFAVGNIKSRFGTDI
jgi:hypothetical protein